MLGMPVAVVSVASHATIGGSPGICMEESALVRANSEISYAKGLEKLANKLTKALDKMKLKPRGNECGLPRNVKHSSVV
ncbi:nostrin isoform X2 [Natator depressus]|uniref:nostrin isoform X2 n=1 Tax=Natator depressus TaxID=27790 RepID=UPI003EBB5365